MNFDETQQLYLKRGFGQSIGFGLRPAILVVDMIQAFTDPSSPLGTDLNAVVTAIQSLLEIARAKRVPIVFTTVVYDESKYQSARLFITKVPALKVLKSGTPSLEIDPRLGRQSTEPLLRKQFASAFLAHPLFHYL